jgi:hypothetical protein
MLNAQLPRFNARWRDPQCEDVDCLHLPDAAWHRENNYCNPPWSALPALAAKLAQSQAATTVIAPYWPSKRGTTLSPGSPPRLYTSRRPATFSFPVGSAGERGSDLPRGVSWPFGSHPLLAVHPTRSDWPCVTPGPINSCRSARSPPPQWTTSLLPPIRSSTGALGRRSG